MSTLIDLDDFEVVPECPYCSVTLECSNDGIYFCPCCGNGVYFCPSIGQEG
nr:hypothetical protein F987_00496 [Acinetobacter gyllenbergii NIPH 230]